jgi:hypothetical protein
MKTGDLAHFAVTMGIVLLFATATARPAPQRIASTATTTGIVPASGPASFANPPTGVIPSNITVELKSPPASGGVIATWSTIIIAIIAALASVAAAIYSARMSSRTQLATKTQDIDLQERLQSASHEHEGSLEGRRLRQARRELATNRYLSESEREQAAWKIVHEQKIEEAKLIHLYFDKLTSKDQHQQDLALFALSAFVDSSVIERLVSGSGIVSNVSASRLAASGDSDAAQAAQAALNQSYADATAAVVVVHLGDADKSSCTGFFVSQRHLVAFALAEQGDTIAFHFDRYSVAGNAQVVAVDRASMLMVAELSRPIDLKPLELTREEVHRNETATMIHRARDGRVVVRSGPVTGVGVQIGVLAPSDPTLMTDNLEIALSVEHGSAGSPVLNDQGRVEGVVVASLSGHSSFSKITYAVGAKPIAAILAQVSVSKT